MNLSQWSFGAAALLVTCQISCSIGDVSKSDVAVTNGKTISEESYAAVVDISHPENGGEAHCTATFISHNTLLTAAHCVEEDATIKIAQAAKNVGVTSLKVIRNNKVKRNGLFFVQNDMALVIFPDNTAPAIIPIAKVKAKANDTIVIVGYGNNDHGRSAGAGKKRWGWNKIKQVNSDGTIDFVGTVRGSGTGEQAVQSQGDSGGPMITKNGIIGVASVADSNRNAEIRGSYNGTYGEVQGSEAKDFLQKGQSLGALIPWFEQDPGSNDKYWEYGFDEAPSGSGLNVGLFSCADDSATCYLGVSSAANVATMKLCREMSVAACSKAAESSDVVTLTKKVSAAADKRTIFLSQNKVSLDSATWTVVAMPASDKNSAAESKQFRIILSVTE